MTAPTELQSISPATAACTNNEQDIVPRLFIEQFVIIMLLLVVENIGAIMAATVDVPYGFSMGFDLHWIAFGNSLRYGLAALSGFLTSKATVCTSVMAVLLVSVIGSTVGLGLQAFAETAYSMDGTATAALVFFGGKAIAGLFGGTKSVLQAIIKSISDEEMAGKRLTIMLMVQPIGGGILNIVGGLISLAGLEAPYYVAATCAALSIFLVLRFGPTFILSPETTVEVGTEHDCRVLRHPWLDPVCWFAALSMYSVWVGLSNWPMLLPLLISLEYFSVDGDEVAMISGLVAGLGGLAVVLGLVLSDQVTRRVGTVSGTHGAAVVAGACYMLWGASAKVWQVFLLVVLQGLAVGVISKHVMPTFSSYVRFAFRTEHHVAAFALLNMGEYLAVSSGQNISAAIIGDNREQTRSVCIIMGLLQSCGFCGFGIFQWLHRRQLVTQEATAAMV